MWRDGDEDTLLWLTELIMTGEAAADPKVVKKALLEFSEHRTALIEQTEKRMVEGPPPTIVILDGLGK